MNEIIPVKLDLLPQAFTVCQVPDFSEVSLETDFCFPQKTDRERSLVCPTDQVPVRVLARKDGWRALRIEGTLDFSLVGILAGISAVLTDAGISLFALSTYDTDYVLVQEKDLENALQVLKKAGHEVARML